MSTLYFSDIVSSFHSLPHNENNLKHVHIILSSGNTVIMLNLSTHMTLLTSNLSKMQLSFIRNNHDEELKSIHLLLQFATVDIYKQKPQYIKTVTTNEQMNSEK